eukprot:TRINITY_DN1874_c0_g1_i2.p1 TRINITY_DN1874_c0_g1~~TRINITY_DN1874_c0_g1_i2.p1  ORF type:complete len:276 (+),score=33.83 TRINITY_DN1874_c0_g1_i2:96-923(+)
MEDTSIHNHNKPTYFVFSTWWVLAILGTVVLCILYVANTSAKKTVHAVLRGFGVSVRRIPRVVKELQRKGFHFTGALIPIIYLIGLNWTTFLDQRGTSFLLFGITFCYFVWDFLRLYNTTVRRIYEERFGFLLRDKERNAFTGTLFYFIGATISVFCFSPPVAVAGILFLIVGDFMAALVGISIGKIKIGKKSLEGSVACFISCFIISLLIFWHVPLGEQLAFWGSLTATVTELLNPPWVDDNLSIPVISGIAMHLIAIRLGITIPEIEGVQPIS